VTSIGFALRPVGRTGCASLRAASATVPVGGAALGASRYELSDSDINLC